MISAVPGDSVTDLGFLAMGVQSSAVAGGAMIVVALFAMISAVLGDSGTDLGFLAIGVQGSVATGGAMIIVALFATASSGESSCLQQLEAILIGLLAGLRGAGGGVETTQDAGLGWVAGMGSGEIA